MGSRGRTSYTLRTTRSIAQICLFTMVTMRGDLQPDCLADRLLTDLGQQQCLVFVAVSIGKLWRTASDWSAVGWVSWWGGQLERREELFVGAACVLCSLFCFAALVLLVLLVL